MSDTISAIVPTIGRIEALTSLLQSLAAQTRRPDEVIVADGSEGDGVRRLALDARWPAGGLEVHYVQVAPPNAVRQRTVAIAQARGSLLLLLDDDVVLEPGCVAALTECLEARGAVAVSADFSNQAWPPPTTLWRWYLRLWHGMADGGWQGRVLGPLLRFGYHPVPAAPAPMEWIGSGNSLIRRDAYDRAGGFSNFFLHRSTLNEDVDLGLKLARVGPMFLCGAARMAHLHAGGGRAPLRVLAEDDLYNRYCILRRTLHRSGAAALALVTLYFAIETVAGVAAFRRFRTNGFGARLAGRVQAFIRIARSAS